MNTKLEQIKVKLHKTTDKDTFDTYRYKCVMLEFFPSLGISVSLLYPSLLQNEQNSLVKKKVDFMLT